MESALPPEQKVSYAVIIDSILASSDINTISAKRIRKGLEAQVGYDLTPQKQPVTDLIMERFDRFQQQRENGVAATVPEPAPTANGTASHPPERIKTEEKDARVKPEEKHASASPPQSKSTKRKSSEIEDDDELSDIADSPPPKKAKKIKPETETDEQVARRVQAELNAQSGRSTRGGGNKKKTPVKKEKKPTTKKKKSKAKINSDDDSEVDGDGGSEKPEREKKINGFNKPMNLSEPLGALLGGETALSRPQTVKRIWAYVKERDLQDPSDKRQIRCDEAMRAVFKQEKVHMFTMNKILATHLYPIEDEGEEGES